MNASPLLPVFNCVRCRERIVGIYNANYTSLIIAVSIGELQAIGKATLGACEFFSVIDAPPPERGLLKERSPQHRYNGHKAGLPLA